MIRAIIFDYYDVLVNDDYWHEVNTVAQQNGRIAEIKQAQHDLNIGISGWQGFCATVADVVGTSSDYVVKRYEAVIVNDELVELIHKLSKTYVIALLSNAEKDQLVPQLHRQKLYNLFSTIGISSEFGIIKPDVRIFTQFANQVGFESGQCLMIDDNAENVTGARATGMQAIQFINNAQLKADLRGIVGT